MFSTFILPQSESTATNLTGLQPSPVEIASPTPIDAKSIGVLRFQDGTATLDQVTISAALKKRQIQEHNTRRGKSAIAVGKLMIQGMATVFS